MSFTLLCIMRAWLTSYSREDLHMYDMIDTQFIKEGSLYTWVVDLITYCPIPR